MLSLAAVYYGGLAFAKRTWFSSVVAHEASRRAPLPTACSAELVILSMLSRVIGVGDASHRRLLCNALSRGHHVHVARLRFNSSRQCSYDRCRGGAARRLRGWAVQGGCSTGAGRQRGRDAAVCPSPCRSYRQARSQREHADSRLARASGRGCRSAANCSPAMTGLSASRRTARALPRCTLRRTSQLTATIETPGFGPYYAAWDSNRHENRIPEAFTADSNRPGRLAVSSSMRTASRSKGPPYIHDWNSRSGPAIRGNWAWARNAHGRRRRVEV